MKRTSLATVLTVALFLLAPTVASAQFAYDPYSGETKQSAQQQNRRQQQRQQAYRTNGPYYGFEGRGRAQGRSGANVYQRANGGNYARGQQTTTRRSSTASSSSGSSGPRGNGLFGTTTAAVVAQTAMQIPKYLNQIQRLRQQYEQARSALRQFSNLNLRNFDGFMSDLGNILEAGQNLTYAGGQTVGQLQQDLNETYPIFSDSELLSSGGVEQLEQGMNDVSNTFQMLRQQSRQIQQAQQQMKDVAQQLNNAQTPVQVQEAAATLQQFQVQNGQMTRQLLMQLVGSQKKQKAERLASSERMNAKISSFYDDGPSGGAQGYNGGGGVSAQSQNASRQAPAPQEPPANTNSNGSSEDDGWSDPLDEE